jgi:hypothetical protein
MQHSQKIEQLFASLEKACGGQLKDSYIKEFQHFINVGEYGIALQTFMYIFIEEKIIPNAEIKRIALTLASEMEFDEIPSEFL